MREAPPRWRDMHPGDMVIERLTTMGSLQYAANSLRPDGYEFAFGFRDQLGEYLVLCTASPRPLIPDRGEA